MAIRIGFFGSGFIAGVHRRNLDDDPRATVTAVYDPLREIDSGLAAQSPEELLERSDAVYIASPNRTHADYALSALAAGKHIFCQKPMAVTSEEARRIHQAARASKRVFQVGHNRRLAPVYKRVRGLLESHPPHCVHARMNRGELLRPAWTGDEQVTGGFLYETPIHMFDMLRFQFGEPAWIEARLSRKDDFSALIGFESGLHATLTTSADASWFFPFERLEVFGEYLTIETAEMESLSWRQGLDSPTLSEHYGGLPLEQKWGFAEGDRRFLDAILDGVAPPADSLDGLRSVEMAEACYLSAREGRAVDLAPRG